MGRTILGVFAHPDDETSGAAGTIATYARKGVDVYVATATRGEQGTLGTNGLTIAREDLPAVRVAEQRSVLELLGAHPAFQLGYRDQGLKDADFDGLVDSVVGVMRSVHPDVVLTFGPTGISRHDDHVTIHQATVEAFQLYRPGADPEPRLFFVAIPKGVVKEFGVEIDGVETEPTVMIDIEEFKDLKIRSWRMYRSQEDAQEVAAMFEKSPWGFECFHQAIPAASDGTVASGFWEDF